MKSGTIAVLLMITCIFADGSDKTQRKQKDYPLPLEIFETKLVGNDHDLAIVKASDGNLHNPCSDSGGGLTGILTDPHCSDITLVPGTVYRARWSGGDLKILKSADAANSDEQTGATNKTRVDQTAPSWNDQNDPAFLYHPRPPLAAMSGRSGIELKEDCRWASEDESSLTEMQHLHFAVCASYVLGVAEGFYLGGGQSCVPNGGNVTNGQLGMVVKKYLDEHPEELHLHSGVLVIKALKKAFPCK